MSFDTKLLSAKSTWVYRNLFFVDLHRTTLEVSLKCILLLINKVDYNP